MMVHDRYGDISLSVHGHVAVLEIDRPPHNHVNVPLVRDLADAFAHLDQMTEIRAVVLQTAGKNFCAGADLENENVLAPESTVDGGNPLYAHAVRLFSNKKPIVMAIQGAVVGAGLGLALVADFRIASPDVRFAANFVKLGFHPGFGITHTLPRLIGERRAALLTLTGRRIKAEEALAWGLIDDVVPSEELRATALGLASEIAENAPLAVQSTRATFREGLAEAVKAQTDIEYGEQEWLRKTTDFTEGLRAVSERRAGVFTAT